MCSKIADISCKTIMVNFLNSFYSIIKGLGNGLKISDQFGSKIFVVITSITQFVYNQNMIKNYRNVYIIIEISQLKIIAFKYFVNWFCF